MTTEIENKRRELEQRREANRLAAENAAAVREMERLDDEIAYEEARGKAYAEVGPERVLGGEVKGAGFAVLVWPDQTTWRSFVNRGILKKDKLTDELCEDLVVRCRRYPTLERFREMLKRNPNASVKLATMLIDAMAPEEDAAGK